MKKNHILLLTLGLLIIIFFFWQNELNDPNISEKAGIKEPSYSTGVDRYFAEKSIPVEIRLQKEESEQKLIADYKKQINIKYGALSFLIVGGSISFIALNKNTKNDLSNNTMKTPTINEQPEKIIDQTDLEIQELKNKLAELEKKRL